MAKILTERLILRPFRRADAPDVFAYAKEADVGPNAGWKPHEDIIETKQIMEEVFLNKDDIWAIELKEERKVIGSVGLIADMKRQNEKVRMLGYAIGKPYWGLGIMTEVCQAVLQYGFSKLELMMISAYVYSFNERSKRVLEKLGFVYEGTLREAEEIYSGAVYDNECYSIAREEYLAQGAK